MYDYSYLEDGSYFCDISLLLNEPNKYSYFWNEFQEKPLHMLSISATIFLDICNKFPNSKEVLKKTALKRSSMFEHYKIIKLLKYMKTIINNQRIINKFGKMQIIDKVRAHMIQRINLTLFECFIEHYKLVRLKTKRMKNLFHQAK